MAVTAEAERTLVPTVVQAYSYVYTGGSLMQMVITTTTTPVDGTATTTTETLNFAYDASGIPMSVDYNGMDYYYVTNIQGDVIAILNTSGTAVVQYTYDAWGNIHEVSGSLADTLGETNPLRYRGYVYDTEIGFYYLQSRYYNPKVGRFINADVFPSTGQGLLGNNMFTYCLNNPVLYIDSSGCYASTPPMIENGLNLLSGGGIPVVIDGTTYYYAIKFNGSGELYEYWFNSNGDLIHVRHHSIHGNSSKHKNPHDHTGYRDKDGHNTHTKGGEPVDEKFQPPKQVTLVELQTVPARASEEQMVFRAVIPESAYGNISGVVMGSLFIGGCFDGIVKLKHCLM